MLDAFIPPFEVTSTNGTGVLKALQNNNLPEVDLLVREAVQNSADAAIDMVGDSSNINFNIGKFTPLKLNAEFKELSDVLDSRFPMSEADYLEIRDSKTVGLTGSIYREDVLENEEDHGNYFKLVFESGREQTNSDAGQAGGSFGYGKSVYFRVGIGLVIFYSKIKTKKGTYESRLIASLVEHDLTGKSMLKEIQKDSIGRAWWGDNHGVSEKIMFPVNDESRIASLLDIFGLTPFAPEETGTSIIIPYIDQKRLLKGIFPEDCEVPEDEINMCSWKDDLAECLKLTIQRWYAPKVFNKHLNDYPEHKWLMVRVNGETIRYKDMRPVFKLVQELYNVALGNKDGSLYESSDYPFIQRVKIPSNKVEGGVAGYAAVAQITKSELSSTGASISPYTYLRLFSRKRPNDPIVMFARTPGMVLDYKIDGKWTRGLTRAEDEESYLFVFFVPLCDVLLKGNVALPDHEEMKLGEYLRKCEKSDHMDWEDLYELTLAANMKNQVTNKVNSEITQDDDVEIGGTVSRLAGRLGKRLLPSVNYGKKPRSGGGGSGGSGGSASSDNLKIEFSPSRLYSDRIELDFTMNFSNSRKCAKLGLFVEDETGSGLDKKTWHSNIGTAFPLRIDRVEKCSIESLNLRKMETFKTDCSIENPIIENALGVVRFDIERGESCAASFSVINQTTNVVVSGTIVIATTDRTYACAVKEIKLAEGENE